MTDETIATVEAISYPAARPIYPLMPLLTGMSTTEAAWQETEGEYRRAAMHAEATSLHAITAEHAAATFDGNARAVAARYEAGIEGFVFTDAEGNTMPFIPKNETERKAALMLSLRTHAAYGTHKAAADELRKRAAEARAQHERAVMDCRLARLRLEMLISIQRGSGFVLAEAGDEGTSA